MTVGETTLIIKVVTGITAIIGVINVLIWKPIKDKMSNLETRLQSTISKRETIEQIEVRQEPIKQNLNSLERSVDSLNETIKTLNESVKGIQMWQQKQVGKAEGKKEGD